MIGITAGCKIFYSRTIADLPYINDNSTLPHFVSLYYLLYDPLIRIFVLCTFIFISSVGVNLQQVRWLVRCFLLLTCRHSMASPIHGY